MKVAVFSSKSYDIDFLSQFATDTTIEFEFLSARLDAKTVELASGYDAICAFVNDQLSKGILTKLASLGIGLVALRCAGFNNVDIKTAKELGIKVCRVPEYSPHAVAEHAVGMMLTLSRKFHKAYNRVKEDNFSLKGLLGFNLHGKTVGIIGGGKIGCAAINILQGFGCTLICFDPSPSDALLNTGIEQVSLEELFIRSQIISLHCPLTTTTHHLINEESINKMQPGVMLINTSRGALIDTQAVISALKEKKLAHLGLDVYEQEESLFFEDLSTEVIQDDTFQRLLTFPNVLITGHQGFFTKEALEKIAIITIENINNFQNNNTAQLPQFLC